MNLLISDLPEMARTVILRKSLIFVASLSMMPPYPSTRISSTRAIGKKEDTYIVLLASGDEGVKHIGSAVEDERQVSIAELLTRLRTGTHVSASLVKLSTVAV